MTPNKAQRVWKNLSHKWINSVPYQPKKTPAQRRRARIRKGTLTNFIAVQVVNAITGEIAKGYMASASERKLIKWLFYKNTRAEVDQIFLPPYNTFLSLSYEQLTDFPVLIECGKHQFPYVIVAKLVEWDPTNNDKQYHSLRLKTVDNLKYLSNLVEKKEEVLKLYNELKRQKKQYKPKKKPILKKKPLTKTKKKNKKH